MDGALITPPKEPGQTSRMELSVRQGALRSRAIAAFERWQLTKFVFTRQGQRIFENLMLGDGDAP
jgi:hypothetical protein